MAPSSIGPIRGAEGSRSRLARPNPAAATAQVAATPAQLHVSPEDAAPVTSARRRAASEAESTTAATRTYCMNATRRGSAP
jgi:hypothetical protein